MKNKTNYRFSNWARNESCMVKNFYQPENESELIDLVKSTKKIRMVGTGHSWSPICITNETLINLDLYNKVLLLDREKKQVTFQSGAKLWWLNEYLYNEGFSLKNLGSISKQSFVGAMATATHGSGISYQILASQVQSITYIKATGEKVKIDKDEQEDLFQLTTVNLGCLGVVSEVTVNITERFHLHEKAHLEKFEVAIEKLEEYIYGSEHFKLWWFPHNEEVLIYRYTHTQEPVNDSRFRQWFMDEFLAVPVYRFLLWLGNISPNLRPKINQGIRKFFLKNIDRIERSWKVFNVPEPPIHRETEWAFDIKDAQQILLEWKRMIEENGHLLNFVQEIRFVKGDNFALSPCYARDSFYLSAYIAGEKGWQNFYQDFEVIAKKYNGRPHWGKEFQIDAAYLKKQYPNFDKFNSIKKEWDWEGKFENNFIRELFSV